MNCSFTSSFQERGLRVHMYCKGQRPELFSTLLTTRVKNKQSREEFSELFCWNTTTHVTDYAFCLGESKDITLERVRRSIGRVIQLARDLQQEVVGTNVFEVIFSILPLSEEQCGMVAMETALLANYSFSRYVTEPVPLVQDLYFLKIGNKKQFQKGMDRGQIIAQATNFTRDLVNEPANVVTSLYLEQTAQKLVARHKQLKLRILNKEDMERLGMGALLGVAQGSAFPPKLLIIEYLPQKNQKPIVLVGKGITFDSGGYNLKPTKHIEDMKIDMAGAGAVLGIVSASAELGVAKNIVGVLPVCENMIGSMAQRPGDIVRAYNGKTIEIGNTDAEGRLILADALSYAEQEYKPEAIIDFATLTGACVVALGFYTAGMMGTGEQFMDELHTVGDSCGDRVWQLPFYEEYQDCMKGTISDLINISQKGKGYEAGAITAGVFLKQFIEKTPWVHIDIAGTAHLDIDGDYLRKGATGSGVRLITHYLLQ